MKLPNFAQRIKEKLLGTQAGARSSQSHSLNYASVNTLDPSRLARAFASADQGHLSEQAALFELVEEQDAHIFAELSKRRRAVTGLGWSLIPPSDATEAEIKRSQELEAMLRSIPRFEDAQYDLTDAIGKGFCALEIEWQTGSVWLPRALTWIPQRLFQTQREDGRLRFLKNGLPEDLREWGWVVHEHRAKSGYIEQAALFRVLAWTYAYKAYDVRDMQRFLELYGLPLRLGKYPAGTPEAQRNELLKAVRNIGNDAAGIVPSSMTIDFVQTVGGKVDDFLHAVAYWEKKQSMAILGGTLTSQADGKTSTNALGVVHDKVRREIMLHDVRQIEPTIHRDLVRPIALVNGMFAEDRLPRFAYLTEETADQAKMVNVLNWATNIGMEISVDYAHQIMQIPKAKDGEPILAMQGGKVPHESKNETGLRAGLTAGLTAGLSTAAPDYATAFAAQLAALCVPHEEALIAAISAIIAESGDYETALSKIETLKTTNPAWEKALAEGMAAAHLAGMAEAGK